MSGGRGTGLELLTRGRYCGEDEENDPSEEFELYLSCAVCGDNCKCEAFECIHTFSADQDVLLQLIDNAPATPTLLARMMVR